MPSDINQDAVAEQWLFIGSPSCKSFVPKRNIRKVDPITCSHRSLRHHCGQGRRRAHWSAIGEPMTQTLLLVGLLLVVLAVVVALVAAAIVGRGDRMP
jgi:hypothetical protein